MTGIDPLKDIPGVKEFQERALVRAVRLTRENAEAIAPVPYTPLTPPTILRGAIPVVPPT